MQLTKTKKIFVAVFATILLICGMLILTACDDDTTQNVSTYEELVNAMNGDSDIIRLTDDIVVEGQIDVTRDVELDMNGKTLSNTEMIYNLDINSWAILCVQKDGDLTITGNGKILTLEDDCFAVCVVDGGNLVIENGEYVGNIHSIYVMQGTALINGGTYSIQQVQSVDKPYEYILNLLDENYTNKTASIVVTGGTFVKFNPQNNQAEGANTNFLADGYVSQYDEESETYTVTRA